METLLVAGFALLLVQPAAGVIHADLVKAQIDVGTDKKIIKAVKTVEAPQICKKDMMVKMGLEGLEVPVASKLKMCSSVTKSCCTIKDQLTIYDLWVKADGPKLEANLEIHRKVYSDLLDVLALIDSRVKSATKERKNPEDECLIIANLLDSFNISVTVETLRSKLELYYKSLVEFHKGMYCALCDSNSHDNINLDKKEITLSERTSRDFVGSGLKFFTYFHSHVPKILNVSSMFVLKCKPNLDYADVAIPPEFQFDIVPDVDTLLINTMEKRNEDVWLENFTKIFSKAKVTEISVFMMPNLKKFEDYSKGMQTILIGPASSTASRNLSSDPQQQVNGANASEPKTDNNEVKLPPINVYEPFKIYTASFKNTSPLDDLKIIVSEKGIDLIVFAKSMKIDEETLKKIDTDIKVEKGEIKAPEEKATNSTDTTTVAAKVDAKGLKDGSGANVIGAWKTLLLLMVVTLIDLTK